MEKISARIEQIVKNEEISVRCFEQIIGCSNGVIAKCISKKTDIGSVWITQIALNFPHYDLEWLLTGRGVMLRMGFDKVSESEVEYKSLSRDSLSCKSNALLIKDLMHTIAQLNRELGMNEEKILQLEDKIAKLQQSNG